LSRSHDEVVRAAAKAIAATAEHPKNATQITQIIRGSKHNFEPETYIQILKSVSELGDVRALQEPSVMLDPIKKLLTHENADVRKAAQDALTAVTTKTGDIKIARN